MSKALSPPFWIACLCAAWCRTCDDYRPAFARVAGEFAERGEAAAPRWIDIDDEAALVGDLEVETFPMLVVGDADRVLFAGPLAPQPETLRRLLVQLLRPGTPAQRELPPAVSALAARLGAAAA